jgi:hypothetical protein
MNDQLTADPLVPMAPGVGKVTICSVWPHPLEKSLMHGGGCRTYKLAAASRGGYSLCDCFDTYELCLDLMHDDDNTAPGLVPKPLTARQVATILMRIWTLDAVTPGGGRIGVEVITSSKPTEEELEVLRLRQATHDQELVAEADVLHISPSPQQRGRIGRRHWRALEDLGSPDPSAHPWYANPKQAPHKDCASCGKSILTKALTCEHCHVFLPEFYMDRLRTAPPKEDPAVLAIYQHLVEAKQVPRPIPPKA